MSNQEITTNQPVRSRFAPSPTGFVHVGNFRTALFAYLFARHHGGTAILRIEDTDQSRKIDGAVENLLSVMKTLGIEFDEGPRLTGDHQLEYRGAHGPYVQSQRLELYKEHAQKLVTLKKAYYCFCTQERLEELRKEQTALKKPPMYDRHCRNLSEDEVSSKLADNPNAVIRQAIPEEGQTIVHDLVYGDIIYKHEILDDQVLLKSDGFPTYHLAVVVDDHYMEITHVIRGEDWIPSTPKHLLLFEAFGWDKPQFAHLPLITNPDKTKLSKRQGDVAVEDFLQKGYLPEALVNFVAFLGWNPKTEQEVFSMQELIEQFDLVKVNKSGAVLDLHKLDWMNGMYIRQTNEDRLLELLKPYLVEQGIKLEDYPEQFLQAVVKIEKERLKNLSQIKEDTQFYFAEPEYDPEIVIWKKADRLDAVAKLTALVEKLSALDVEDFVAEKLEAIIKEWIGEQGFDTGNVLWPMRVALTGLAKSPSPFEVAGCLVLNGGKENVINRLNKAINLLS
ncbi:glutamate--tRNA ligase [bacterium]|nr:MAG: glutamate--tRNA ligase [bacterium]